MTLFLETNGIELVEDKGYPGRFINNCFECNVFSVDKLHDFLTARCRWITGE
ncbi:hypothetical protein [Chachezhania sediminis]|uniref:hypothetical protein n=1 Tax=Chachezhania sediminis TaxID=2599291 RepID=UPI00131C3B07|nr:hypothetical protein [Chachezhania sediminis]